MKNHLLLPALSLGLTLMLTPARAEDRAPSTLTPEMQELLAQLLKAAAEARQESAPQPEPARKLAASQEAKVPAKRALQATSLTTGGLTTTGLAPSAPIGGRGTTGGAARLNEEDWRALFAAKPARR